MSILDKEKLPILSRYDGENDADLTEFFTGLTDDEKQQAQKEAEEVGAILLNVFDGFSKAFVPVAEAIKNAMAKILEGLPEETKAELLKRNDS